MEGSPSLPRFSFTTRIYGVLLTELTKLSWIRLKLCRISTNFSWVCSEHSLSLSWLRTSSLSPNGSPGLQYGSFPFSPWAELANRMILLLTLLQWLFTLHLGWVPRILISFMWFRRHFLFGTLLAFQPRLRHSLLNFTFYPFLSAYSLTSRLLQQAVLE